MILFYLGQVPAQWFTEAGDASLSGGVLRFFAVGTSTPKAVYSDYQGVTAAGTSVVLDSSGRANVFLDGLYSVTLETSTGVQIGPKVDGIGNAAMVGDGQALVLEIYDDLRQFDGDDFRACVLQGRIANGDGGAGIFVWDAMETAADDGGTILAPATLPVSGRWVRIRGETVDPRWYGCKMDGTTADDAQFAIAAAAAVSLKARLHLENGYIRISSNFTFPVASSISAGYGAGLIATSGTPTLTFPAGSTFSGSPSCFGGTLQPIFSGIDTPVIPLSWMGGANNDAALDKWAASAGMAGQTHLLDKSVSGIIPTFGAGMKLDIIPGCLWTVNATAQDLDVDVIYQGVDQWMDWGAVANVGTVNIGNRACPVGWFGAIGDLSDETTPLYAAIQTAWIQLGFGRYLHDDDISVSALRVDGQIADACAVGIISATRTDMPISSLVIGDTFTMTATGDIAFSGAGFYASEGGIDCAGTMSGRNSVFACYDGAGITAVAIDTQDCYANSPLVFLTTGDLTTFHSNLKTNAYDNRRHFGRGTSLGKVFHTEEIGTSNVYDIVLVAANGDGLEDGKTSLTLETVISKNFIEAESDYTRIKFVRLAGPMWEIYRDGVLFALDDGSGNIYYAIQEEDKAKIVVECVGSPGSAFNVIVPAEKPSGSERITIVSITPSILVVVGENVSGDVMWNSAPVWIPPTFSTSLIATCVFSEGKWAVG